MHPIKTADAQALIPGLVQAALGAKSFRSAAAKLSTRQQAGLTRALATDVETFRQQFGARLRETAEELLEITKRDLELIKPDARAYTLAVLIDKASALEGRAQVQSATINLQVNNYGDTPKAELIAQLASLAPIPSSHAHELIRSDHANEPQLQSVEIVSSHEVTLESSPGAPVPAAEVIETGAETENAHAQDSANESDANSLAQNA